MAAAWNLHVVPAYKLFIQDLTNCKKNENGWEIYFGNVKEPKALEQFQLQVTVLKLTGFNNEIMIVSDGTGKAKATRGPKVPGDFSWVKTGVVCSLVGTLLEAGKLPHVDLVKMAPSENPVQNEMWPLEVQELRNFMANKVVPQLS